MKKKLTELEREILMDVIRVYARKPYNRGKRAEALGRELGRDPGVRRFLARALVMERHRVRLRPKFMKSFEDLYAGVWVALGGEVETKNTAKAA